MLLQEVAMHIECFKLNGVDYLRLAESFAVQVNGQTRQKKRVVLNIGPMKRFDDGAPEYLARLRLSFRQGEPLISSLGAYVKRALPDLVALSFDRNSTKDCESDPKNIGYFLLDALFDALGVGDVLALHKSRAGLRYDINGLARLLVLSRALRPASKISTYENREGFLLPLTESTDWHDIYTCLDDLDLKAESIQKRMNLKIDERIGRSTEVAYYDVTNYFFETEYNDPDLDAVKGLRKKGVSKENRRTPIVQMGLFMDDKGIPISYQLFPGNTLDHATLRPTLKKTIDRYEFDRLIVVADRGLTSDRNLAHIVGQGNGYVMSKSIRKSRKVEREWVLDQTGYVSNESGQFKCKSRIVTRTIRNEDNQPVEIKEKVVCYWSKRFHDRELRENKTFLQTLQRYIDDPASIRSEKGKLKQFLDEYTVDEQTGEILKPKKVLAINLDKAMEFRELMGYYVIVSSEVNKSEAEIIDTYRGLTRIENAFRMMKGDLQARPVFVNTAEHIRAHFLICFVALTMIRLIQHRILAFQGKPLTSTFDWEEGLSAARIQKALQDFTADALTQGYYRLGKRSDDLTLILCAFGIDHDLRLPTLSDLKQYRFNVRKTLI
jgi:transposase